MKINLIVLICIFLAGFILVSGAGCYSTSGNGNTGGNQQPNSVEMSNFAFSPATLTIKVGDTVTWTNKDSVQHTVTSDSGSELGSSPIPTGQSYSHTFSSAGTFAYHCSIHTTMHGTIIVQ